MLIETDRRGKTKSIFECDRCGRIINTETDHRFKLTVQNTPRGSNTNVIKSWDLCKRCYAALYKGIEKEK